MENSKASLENLVDQLINELEAQSLGFESDLPFTLVDQIQQNNSAAITLILGNIEHLTNVLKHFDLNSNASPVSMGQIEQEIRSLLDNEKSLFALLSDS